MQRNAPVADKGNGSESAKLKQMIKHYLDQDPEKAGAAYQTKNVPELEVRFGTAKGAGSRTFSKVDYDLVVQSLYAANFVPEKQEGDALLRIQTEYYDKRTNRTKISNIRAEMTGMDLIDAYCRTNSIQKILDRKSTENAKTDKIKFTQKSPAEPSLRMADFPDMGFRVSYQYESYYNPRADISRKIIDDWKNSKKIFRYLNRTRFVHPDIPIFVDISIVKSSKTMNYVPIPQYSIQDSGVFTNQEKYEIELEFDNSRTGKYDTETLLAHLRNMVRLVMSALQQTKYPIGMKQMKDNITEYLHLIHYHYLRGEDRAEVMSGVDAGNDMSKEDIATLVERRDLGVILPKFFIGPSSYTLQLENVASAEVAAKTGVPNIRTNYTVTDKADGERRLLYINSIGRVFMISTSMQFIFTGMMLSGLTEENRTKVCNTLLDGEFISYDKMGRPINLYMAFDVYFIGGKPVRKEGFYPITVEERRKGNYRFLYLEKYVRETLRLVPVTQDRAEGAAPSSPVCGFSVDIKNFYIATEGDQIFEACGMILAKDQEGGFQYNTDGLIFTPALTGVGADRIGVAGRMRKDTWAQSFKWKPPKYNTIDFLVTVKKDKKGQDEIQYKTADGRNLQDGMREIPSYKTLILRCGFDPKVHGFLNPCSDVLHDRIPGKRGDQDMEDYDHYHAVPFQPSDPEDPNACFCNIMLQNIGGKMVMMTEPEDGHPTNESNTDTHQSSVAEFFDENMIVEFKYDISREGFWKWVPIRVRYDKTAELRAGQRNFGNSYHVANANWASIHSPITEQMITTGANIPTVAYNNNDVYYNRKNRDSYTRGLRNFHNLYVKRALIMGVSNSQDRLIDFAVGKAGDLSKWRMADLKFVLGIDVALDNIMNKQDGACARYLSDCRKYGAGGASMPRCLFFVGDCAKNVRSNGEAFSNANDRKYVHAVFGKGDRNPTDLPPGVYRSYGIAETGFDVASCQFALHYFFETEHSIHQFLRNLTESVRVGGYFIGTTYDGNTVFNTLRDKQPGESWVVMHKGQKIAEITKDYKETELPEDEESIGMRIQVYQESINQTIPEYLVNFKYLQHLLELYGFVLVPDDEAQKKTGLPHGSGMFEELFKNMQREIRDGLYPIEEYGSAHYMTGEEKRISFLNRYFIFRKTHTVDADNIYKIVTEGRRKTPTKEKAETLQQRPNAGIVRTKKLKKKLVIRGGPAVTAEEDIANMPIGSSAVVRVRVPKNKTKKVITGGMVPNLDARVDIYEIAPSINEVNPSSVHTYIEDQGVKVHPVEQVDRYLDTLVKGEPPAFVHQVVRVEATQ